MGAETTEIDEQPRRDDGATAGAGQALARVLATDPFARSKRNSDLLAHLVDVTAAGDAETLNGTSIAQDVFGKGAEFDPASDPSVRVQMGRLRRMLADYYAGEGADDPLRIEIPKGSYVPLFVPTGADATAAREDNDPDTPGTMLPEETGPGDEAVATRLRARRLGRRWWRPAVALLAVGLIATVALHQLDVWSLGAEHGEPDLTLPVNQFPVVVVRSFENRTGDPENDDFVRGFQRQFAADLQRFPSARIALDEPPPVADVPGVRARADFLITGAVLSVEPTIDVLVWLIDANDASLTVTERLRLDVEGNYLETLDSFSQQLSAQFAAPRGRLQSATRRNFGGAIPDPGGDLAAFRCLSSFAVFRTSLDVERFPELYDCLVAQSRLNADNGALLAALSWMTLLSSPETGMLRGLPAKYRHNPTEALAIAQRAVAVDPANDDAHAFLGLIQWFLGGTREAIASVRRAVQLNPASPEHRADYALRLAMSGDWDASLKLARQALAWDVNPPGWYQLPLFYRALADEDGTRMRALIELGVLEYDPASDIYRLIAASLEGDAQRAAALVPSVLALPATRAGDALRYARPWLRSPEILAIMERELRAQGIPVGDGPPPDRDA